MSLFYYYWLLILTWTLVVRMWPVPHSPLCLNNLSPAGATLEGCRTRGRACGKKSITGQPA